MPFDDEEVLLAFKNNLKWFIQEAIRIANDTEFGLAAGVFTKYFKNIFKMKLV